MSVGGAIWSWIALAGSTVFTGIAYLMIMFLG